MTTKLADWKKKMSLIQTRWDLVRSSHIHFLIFLSLVARAAGSKSQHVVLPDLQPPHAVPPLAVAWLLLTSLPSGKTSQPGPAVPCKSVGSPVLPSLFPPSSLGLATSEHLSSVFIIHC